MMIYRGRQLAAEFRGGLFTLISTVAVPIRKSSNATAAATWQARFPTSSLPAIHGFGDGTQLWSGWRVFVLDWSDTANATNTVASIEPAGDLKITYGQPDHTGVSDFARLSAGELVKLHHAPENEWFSRQARSNSPREPKPCRRCTAKKQLHELFEKQTDIVRELRAVLDPLRDWRDGRNVSPHALRHPNEHVAPGDSLSHRHVGRSIL